MTVKMPGALWVPIKRNYTNRRRARTTALILHIAVSETASLRGWFNNPSAGASSHMYVRRDGTIEQYIDLDKISWANGQGNSRSVTVETQGMGSGSWTSAQCKSLAAIASFCNSHYGIPLQVMHNSRPATHGVGYHRLGVNPWRVSGGETWSKSRGKICPGYDRIPQIPGIVSAAKGDGAISVGGAISGKTHGYKDNVRIQKLLKSHGYYKGIIDGVDGPMQKAAVKAFQKRHGLVEDGYFGPVSQATWDRATAPKAVAPKPKPKPVLRKSTSRTKSIQKALARMGHYKGAIDGIYGPVTEEAVRYYQKHQLFGGLVADGNWGPKTSAHYTWVKKLQKTMNKWKGGNLRVDGDYGPRTRRRVKDVMTRNHGGKYKGVIDSVPGPMFCAMLKIKTHP